MIFRRNVKTAAGLAVAISAFPLAATAGTITANCTGMMDFDIYTFDTEKEMQEINKIGMSKVEITDEAIVLTGDFGDYRFDLGVGTLYHNGTDTGIYCTYSGDGLKND